MMIHLKKQCLGLLSLWQCFPLLGIIWRQLLLSLQTKSSAVWTIGRALVFRSGSRYNNFLKYFTFVHCKRKHTLVHPEEIGRPFVFRGGSHFAGPGQMTLSCLQLNCAVKPWSHTSAFPLSLKRNLLPPKGFTTNIPKINSRRESLGKRYRINRNRKCKLRKP